jgi:ketosteroid isomerase-like protein
MQTEVVVAHASAVTTQAWSVSGAEAHRQYLQTAPEISRRCSIENPTLARWHDLVRRRDAAGLHDLLAEDVVFHSPVVHTPQRGRQITQQYLAAAFQVLSNPSFRYVREVAGEHDAVLEFMVEIDGISVNGVDIIKWNEEGRIVEFKVMLRPLKAVNIIHQKMAEMLAKRQ